MIDQLIGDLSGVPYLKLIEPISIEIKKSYVTKLELKDLLSLLFGDTTCCVIECNGFILKNNKDYQEMFNSCKLEELEDALLFKILFTDKNIDLSLNLNGWNDLTTLEKLVRLKIPEYSFDRNLNDLIMYIEFLMGEGSD